MVQFELMSHGQLHIKHSEFIQQLIVLYNFRPKMWIVHSEIIYLLHFNTFTLIHTIILTIGLWVTYQWWLSKCISGALILLVCVSMARVKWRTIALSGTNLLRAYMHGFFVDIRLYKKAKSVAEPFAFEEYKRKKVREKIEEDRTNRVKMQVRECGRRHNLRSIL